MGLRIEDCGLTIANQQSPIDNRQSSIYHLFFDNLFRHEANTDFLSAIVSVILWPSY